MNVCVAHMTRVWYVHMRGNSNIHMHHASYPECSPDEKSKNKNGETIREAKTSEHILIFHLLAIRKSFVRNGMFLSKSIGMHLFTKFTPYTQLSSSACIIISCWPCLALPCLVLFQCLTPLCGS